jgi:hypothetical protein
MHACRRTRATMSKAHATPTPGQNSKTPAAEATPVATATTRPQTCDRCATPCYTLGPYLFPIKSSLDSANRFSTQHTLRVLHNTHSMCCTTHKLPLAMCFQGSVHRGEVQPQGVPQSASLSPRITHRLPQRLINLDITCASANSLHTLQGATGPHLCCCCPPGGSSLAHTVPPMTHKQAATTDTPLAKHTVFSLVAGKG